MIMFKKIIGNIDLRKHSKLSSLQKTDLQSHKLAQITFHNAILKTLTETPDAQSLFLE